MKIKRDKYFRERGKSAKIINIACMKCGHVLFVYQKDGPGWLKRCYLNRIIEPRKYSELQLKIKSEKELGNLVCDCGSIIGSPINHKDGRIAFSLIRGRFKRGLVKGVD